MPGQKGPDSRGDKRHGVEGERKTKKGQERRRGKNVVKGGREEGMKEGRVDGVESEKRKSGRTVDNKWWKKS
jgi:hypothetical protein